MVLPFYIFSEVTSLLTVRISPRIIISVALQQVNDAPDSETCAKCDDEGLKNIDSRVKEIHKCVCRNAGCWVRDEFSQCKRRNENRCAAPDSGVSFQFLIILFVPALQYEPVSSVCHGVSSLLP